MTIIWIIEKPVNHQASSQHSLADALMGNYPVRVFASLFSFQNLLRSKKQPAADLIVIDGDEMSVSTSTLNDLLNSYMPDAVKILVCKENSSLPKSSLNTLSHIHFMQKPFDAFNLSLFVEKLFTERNKQLSKRQTLRFRDIKFDLVNFTVSLEAEDKAEQLPLKEAQILRLLMEKTGRILSREEIKDHLWTGLNVTPRTIDSHVSRLRGRLKNSEVSIVSVYGGGYQLR